MQRLIWERRGLFGFYVVLVALAVSVASFALPRKYLVEVVLAPVENADEGKLGSLSSKLLELGGLDMFGTSEVKQKEVAIATLKSRLFLEKFITDEQLLTVLFASQWDAANQRWDENDPDDIPTMWDAYEKFRRKLLRVEDDRKTGLVTLGIRWKDRQLAVRWANLLVERINQRLRELAIEEATRSLEYLNHEYDNTNIIELKQAIAKLIEIKIKKQMVAKVNQEYAFKVIDPASSPDADDYVFPRLSWVVPLGIVLGMIAGVVVLVARDWRLRRRGVT